MRIRQLRVDGFGVWTGLELSDLNEPLVVFYGANEAGKTTLMQFVRAVLYGFSDDRRQRYLPPVGDGRLSGGLAGGSLTIDDAQQTFIVDRHVTRNSQTEQLAVTDSQGLRREGRPLALLLDGVDEAVFNNVFAFGLTEVQELSTLTDGAAADLLYELTLGLDRVSLSEVLHELESSRRRLLCEENGTGQITELSERRDRLRLEIHDLAQGTPRYLELVQKRTELDRSAAELEAQEVDLEHRGQVLSLAQQLEPRWRSRQEIERKTSALGAVPHIADDCLPRLEDLKARLTTRRNRLNRVVARRKELAGEMGRLRINDALCRQSPRLEALAEQQQWIAALDAQARQLEAELAEMSADRKPDHELKAGHDHSAAQQHRHGHHGGGGQAHPSNRDPQPAAKHKSIQHHAPAHHSAPTEKHLAPAAAQPLSPQTIASLRTQGKALAELRRQRRQAQADMAAARETAHGFKQQVQSGLGDAQDESLDKSLERAGTLVSQLRRRVQLDERLDQLDRRRHDIEDKAHDSLDRQVPPTWQLVSHFFMFGLGIMLLLAGFFLPAAITHGWGLVIAFLGLGASGVAAVMTYGAHHMSGQQFNDCQKQLDQLKEQIAAAEKERDELDKLLPKGGGPLAARLQTAEQEHARLEELLPLDSHHQHGLRTYKSAKTDHRTTSREFRKARSRWRHSLTQAGLPSNLSPRQLKATIERGRELQAVSRQLAERRAQLTDCRRQHEILAERILQVAVDARLELDETDPLALLREMLRQLQDEQLRLATRDQLRVLAAKLRRVKRKLLRQVAAVNTRLADLIRGAGARDEEDLRRRLGVLADARRLDAERQALDDDLSAALAAHDAGHEVAATLDAGHDLRQRLEEIAAEKQALRTRQGRVWEERGALAEQIKAAALDRRLAEKKFELSQATASLRQAIHRWQVLGACSLALDSVREVYERQRQPEVLREASEYFARLTGGRYTRTWTSLGHRVLWVDDAEGRPLAVDKLSRGTREQLFLSLRLALVSAYARRGLRLPIVMDDVLVNFDVGRVKAAVAVLRDFAAAGHQILVFTCHEHIAQLFRNGRVEVRTLPGNTLRRDAVVEVEPEQPPSVLPAPPFQPATLPEPVALPEPVEEEELTLAEIDDEPPPALRVLEFDPLPEPAPAPDPVIDRPPARNGRSAKPRRPRLPVEPIPVAIPRRRLARIKQIVRQESRVDSVPWSAEEFDGELADRVRRSEPSVEYVEQVYLPTAADETGEELLEVQFEDDAPRHGRNGRQAH